MTRERALARPRREVEKPSCAPPEAPPERDRHDDHARAAIETNRVIVGPLVTVCRSSHRGKQAIILAREDAQPERRSEVDVSSPVRCIVERTHARDSYGGAQ